MKRRFRYLLLLAALYYGVFYYLEPYLYEYVTNGIWELETFRLIFYTSTLLVTVLFGVIIILEGKYYHHMKIVGGFLIVSACMDFIRMYLFPEILLETYIVSMFTGVLTFAFGLVSHRNVVFKNSIGIIFIVLGFFNLLRFPIFIDILYFYFFKFSYTISFPDGYYYGSLYINYVIIILEFIALDAIVRENLDTFRYKQPQV